jgi:hypothetical protein
MKNDRAGSGRNVLASTQINLAVSRQVEFDCMTNVENANHVLEIQQKVKYVKQWAIKYVGNTC